MKFSACGVEDNPHPDDRTCIRLTVHKDGFNEHVDVPVTTTWKDVIGQVFKGSDEPKLMSYKDDEEDTVYVGSENEWEEAIKVEYRRIGFVPKAPEVVCLGRDTIKPNRSTASDNEDKPPKWFTQEMEKLKMEFKSEISSQFAKILPIGSVKPTNLEEDCHTKKPDVEETASYVQPKMQRLQEMTLERNGGSRPSDKQSFKGDDVLGQHPFYGPQICPSNSQEGICHQPFKPTLLSPMSFPETFYMTKSKVSPLKKASDNVVHVGIMCQKCKSNIVGIRYKCGNCVDFDLCTACEANEKSHFSDHVFLKIRRPIPAALEKVGAEKPRPLLKNTVYSKLVGHALRKRTQKPKVVNHILDTMWNSMHEPGFEETGEVVEAKSDNGDREPETGMIPRIDNFLPVKSTMDAKFLFDETVLDGTKFLPGTVFTKKWRLVNFGCKPWDRFTTLKFLWGTKGFTPTSMEVYVPHLAPRQNGLVSVQYKAPATAGFHESHWTLTHKGHHFGHRIWCSIQVVDPEASMAQSQETETGENCNLNEEARAADEDHVKQKTSLEQSEKKTSNGPSPTKSSEPSVAVLSKDSEISNSVTHDREDPLRRETCLLPPSLKSGLSTDSDSELSSDSISNSYIYACPGVPPPLPPASPMQVSREAFIDSDNESFDFADEDGELLNSKFQNPLSEVGQTDADDKNHLSKASTDSGSVINLSCSGSETEFVVVPMPSCFDIPFVAGCNGDSEIGVPSGRTDEKIKPLSKSNSVMMLTLEGEEIPEPAADHDPRLQAAGDVEDPMEKLDEQISEWIPNHFERMYIEVMKSKRPSLGENSPTSKSSGDKRRDSLAGAAASILDSACSAISALQWVPIPPDDNGDYIDPNLASPTPFPFQCLAPSFTNSS